MLFIFRQFRLNYNLSLIFCMAAFRISEKSRCLETKVWPWSSLFKSTRICSLGDQGEGGVSECLHYNGWQTLLLDVSSGQLVLRPQWPRSSSVITKVKNPLKGCSQRGRARPECPPARSCFLLDWSVHARLFQPVRHFIDACLLSSQADAATECWRC